MINWQLKTPVVFIIFNRPGLSEKVFAEISKVKPHKLLVIADGPREDNSDDVVNCSTARSIIEKVNWDCEVLKNYSDTNLGCKIRVSTGLDWVFQNVEEAIILEDDCVPHSTFFRFCEELLKKYRDNAKIMHISGDNFQFGRKRTNYSYYFSRYAHCWGWATWRRAWQCFDIEMKLWREIRNDEWLRAVLNDTKAVKQWHDIFDGVSTGKIDSWAYIWTFVCWIKNGLSVLPNVNLVSNIGFGSNATHTIKEYNIANMKVEAMEFPLLHPSLITADISGDKYTQKHIFMQTNMDKIFNRIMKLYLNLIRKLA